MGKQQIGEYIAMRRKQLGLSQRALAEKIGYSAQALCKIEVQSRTFSSSLVPMLAKALDVTAEDLFLRNPFPSAFLSKPFVLSNDFAGALLRFREEQSLLQAEVAEAVGLTPRTYRKIEKGVLIPSFSFFDRLFEVYSLPIDLFFPNAIDQPALVKKHRPWVPVVAILVPLLALTGLGLGIGLRILLPKNIPEQTPASSISSSPAYSVEENASSQSPAFTSQAQATSAAGMQSGIPEGATAESKDEASAPRESHSEEETAFEEEGSSEEEESSEEGSTSE